MGISVNGPSGIDTAYIIDSLVSLEKKSRIKPIEQLKSAYELKIEAYASFQSLVSDLAAKAFSLQSQTSFSLFTEKSSHENLVTVEGDSGGQPGVYNVTVFHTATAEKMISRKGIITSDKQSLSSQGIHTGTISINGMHINIDDNDTIHDVRMKINTATDANGKKIGVTATVIKAAENDFRLVLTATNTGKDGVAYEDVSGSVLQDLGIIVNAAGDKGLTTQTISSVTDIVAAFEGLAIGESITWTGTDHDGNAVRGTFLKGAGTTLENLLQKIMQSYHGMANATIDGDGNLVITDKIAGISQMSMTSLVLGGATYTMNTTLVGASAEGVLVAGSNAYFSIDGLLLESSGNAASGYIQGVTLNLKKADASQTVSIVVDRDYKAIVEKIQKLIDAYNALVKFHKEKARYADQKDSKSKNGPLSGDQNIGMIVSQLRAQFQAERGLPGAAFRRLLDIGLKTDYAKGEFTLDEEKLLTALKNNFDDVVGLFVTAGSASISGIVYGRSTADTQSGEYELEEVGTTVMIRRKNEEQWYEASSRTGDIVTFDQGPAKGLSLTMAVGVIPENTTATFTFSKGLSDAIKQLADNFNDRREGLIAVRQESYRRAIKSAQDRIDRLNDSIDRYRERLVRQFSAMEKILSELQGQSANMLNAMSALSRYREKR